MLTTRRFLGGMLVVLLVGGVAGIDYRRR